MSLVPLILYDLGNLAYHTICDVTRGGGGGRETMNCGRGLWGGRETMNFILHTHYVNTCGRALWGRWVNNEQKLSAVAHVIIVSC
jgi:hypothetical protein